VWLRRLWLRALPAVSRSDYDLVRSQQMLLKRRTSAFTLLMFFFSPKLFYNHLQNRLGPLSPEKILGTDYIGFPVLWHGTAA
jgi:hypothetical protein